MGRTAESKKTNRMMDQEFNRNQQAYQQYLQSRNTRSDEAYGRSNDVFNSAYGGYNKFLEDQQNAPKGVPGGGESRNSYREASRGGLVTPENIARMRGGGVFDEFAKTGGWNEGDKTNLRSRMTRTIPSFYDAIMQQMQRQQTGSNGGNPSFDASLAALTRQQAQATSDATTDAELEIQDRVNSGRQWGAGSMSDAERAVVDATMRGKMWGTEGLERGEGRDADYDLQNRGLTLSALQGLRGLRTDTPGESALYEDAVSGGLAGQAGTSRGLLQDRAAYNPNQSWLERMSPLINAGVGIGTSFLPGGQFRSGGRAPSRGTVGGSYRPTAGTSSAGAGYYGVF